MKRRKLWLCAPPIALCLIDQAITLAGQPARYWEGLRFTANEASPLFNWLLRQHPLAFEAGIAAWILFFCTLIIFLPTPAAMVISIAIVLGHTWGTATWLTWYIRHGYWLALALFLGSAMLIVWTWERFGGRTSGKPASMS